MRTPTGGRCLMTLDSILQTLIERLSSSKQSMEREGVEVRDRSASVSRTASSMTLAEGPRIEPVERELPYPVAPFRIAGRC